MRLGCVLLAWLLASACTDGVGVPIREALGSAQEAGAPADSPLDAGLLPADAGTDAAGHCEGVQDWPADLARSEDELLQLINAVRGSGFECGGRLFDPRRPLLPSVELRCSARLHSMDMVRSGFVGRQGSDNSLPVDRMEAAGFPVGEADEAVANGELTAVDAFQDFRNHGTNVCRLLADRDFTHIGVGRYQGHWTVDLAEWQSSSGTGER